MVGFLLYKQGGLGRSAAGARIGGRFLSTSLKGSDFLQRPLSPLKLFLAKNIDRSNILLDSLTLDFARRSFAEKDHKAKEVNSSTCTRREAHLMNARISPTNTH
jgi:hypothetical protein